MVPDCMHCGGDGKHPHLYQIGEACPCCDGEGAIYVEDVAAEYLVSWRNHEGVEAEFMSRGDIAWVRDCAGAIMPGNEADIAGGCEIIEMVVSIAQAAE